MLGTFILKRTFCKKITLKKYETWFYQNPSKWEVITQMHDKNTPTFVTKSGNDTQA